MPKYNTHDPILEDKSFLERNETISSTECTGLIPSAVEDEAESDSYQSLYSVHKQKPVEKKDAKR